MSTVFSSRVITWLPTLLLICGPFASAQPAEEVVHVSVAGDKSGDGSEAAPLRSLEQAQAEVRRRIANGLSGNVRIVVHPGIYQLAKTLQLTGNDVPVNGSLTISAAKPNTVTISGGRQVGGWTMSDEKNVWISEKLPDAVERSQLFFGDQRATRAREPDGDYFRVASTGDDGRTSFGVDDAAWQVCSDLTHEQAQQVEVALLHDWSMSRVRVAKLNDKTVHLADRVGAAHDFFRINGFETNPRFFFENARRFVDSEGEFFLDPIENRIHLYTAKVNAATVPVIQPTLETLLSIRGTAEKPARRINIEAIVFSHTTCPLPPNGYAGIQASHFEGRDSAGIPLKADSVHESDRPCPPAAIEIAFASDCTFRDCQFRHLGGGGIYLNQQTSKTKITECLIDDVGANAIMIGETVDQKDETLLVNSNEVSQCKISRCGQVLFGSVGIWIGISSDNKIIGNEISNLPYTGISVGWRWNDTPSGCKNNLIADNHIHHVMQVLSDGGGIYTLGRQPGTRIANNRIHNIPLNMGRAESNGIFMDEGSSGMIVEKNIIYEIARSPLRFHKCKSIEVRTNQLYVREGASPFTYNNTDKSLVHLSENQVLSGSPDLNQTRFK